MHHLHNLQQIILVQLLQSLGQLVHVKALAALAPLFLLWFLDRCNPDFTYPFLIDRAVRVAGDRARISKRSKEDRFGRLERYDMFDFIA